MTQQTLSRTTKELHERAFQLSRRFRETESELIDILQKVDEHRAFLELGFPSLFEYALSLELSEANAQAFTSVARKAKIIPELKTEIQKGTLTVSKARRIIPVITPENKESWINKAVNLSKRELEREVVKEKPELLKREIVRLVQEDRFTVHFSVSERLMTKIKRVQNLLSTQKRKNMNLEASIEMLVDEFLERKDPVVKAKRVIEKKQNQNRTREKAETSSAGGGNGTLLKGVPVSSPLPSNVQKNGTVVCPGQVKSKTTSQPHIAFVPPKREPIPAAVKHVLYQNHHGQCAYVSPQGKRCTNERWLEIHHKQHVSKNGGNNLENLTLLCWAHHALNHQRSKSIER